MIELIAFHHDNIQLKALEFQQTILTCQSKLSRMLVFCDKCHQMFHFFVQHKSSLDGFNFMRSRHSHLPEGFSICVKILLHAMEVWSPANNTSDGLADELPCQKLELLSAGHVNNLDMINPCN